MVLLAFDATKVAPKLEPVKAPQRAWSPNQIDIFDFTEYGSGNAIVEAVAGSGKSTTIVECLQRLPENLSSVFLAFNKAIADELKYKGVNARTFHSLTYSAVTRFKNCRQVDANKLRTLIDRNLNGNDAKLYGTFITRLCGLAKQVGVGCLVRDVEAVWLDIVTYHDLELEEDGADLGRAMELASDLLAWSNADNSVDFDDLLYIPVKEGLSLPKFDFVFVDEAQDTNGIQRALLRKILKPDSRMIAVGDPAQAIYGFRGSDSNSLTLLAQEFNCVTLPLSVSYRCPTSVVKYARQWVDHIEAAPGAPAGRVAEHGAKWELADFEADDLVVCRTTKPLISLGYKLLRARIPAQIMGREIGQGMKALINKMKGGTVDGMLEGLSKWETREVEKARAKGLESKVEAINDKADAIRLISEDLEGLERTIPFLLNVIDQLFSVGINKVTLATIHKSKGLEARRVWWLNRAACPAKWARQDWQKGQEVNLCYVATTRAKEELHMFEEKT